jgi:hypothetical protein
MKSSTRSSYLTPFRADQATAASDIVVCVAADDMRYFTAAVAHQMSVYATSAFLGRNALRANIARQARLFFMGPLQLPWLMYAGVRGLF